MISLLCDFQLCRTSLCPSSFSNFFSFWLTLYGIYFLITFFTDHIGVFLCVWVCGKSEFVASAALCRPLPSPHVCALVMCVLLCQHWAIVHWELTGIIKGDCGMSFQPPLPSPSALPATGVFLAFLRMFQAFSFDIFVSLTISFV